MFHIKIYFHLYQHQPIKLTGNESQKKNRKIIGNQGYYIQEEQGVEVFGRFSAWILMNELG